MRGDCMNTYNDIYITTRRRLRAAGIEAHDLEARLIVAHAAGKSREELIRCSRLYVPDSAIVSTVDAMVTRRVEGEPVAYIVGEWEFLGLPMTVNRDVMIPRIDTELLAKETIRLIRRRNGQARVLDLCAGSGCIGLSVSANVPSCRIVLADNSERALAVCRMNMQKNNLSRNITAIELDALETHPALLGKFDAIVSNPPYIPTGDLDGLDASVRDYEPREALDGGPDGLYFYRGIVTNWTSLLKAGGFFALECGVGQSKDVRGILMDAGIRDIVTHIDTLGIERVLIGTV